MDTETIRLTETVSKGGCAAKLPAGQLRAFLSKLSLPQPKELIVGTSTLDDACLWELGDGRLLVQTLDFFTPIVDDAKDFGAIAAANALSDVYAMGGEPKIALTIMGFPASKLPLSLIEPLMAGAVEKITESGACLAGGHTIDDDTLKLGFSVTGFVDRHSAWKNSGAEEGDHLILTKGLGTGTITSASKNKKATPQWIEAAITSMKQLNRVRHLLNGVSIHAATDVTGFGLAGHSMQMAEASGKSFVIHVSTLPHITGAIECLREKILNKAHHSNLDYVKASVDFGDIAEELRWLTVDPQTSGGLLLSVSAKESAAVVKQLLPEFPLTRTIGEVIKKAEPTLRFD